MNLIQSKGKWTSREGQGDTGTGERCNERTSSTASWKKEAYKDYVPNTLDTHRNSSPAYSLLLQVDDRDKQTGTKWQRLNVEPFCGMKTLVRRSNKKWSPGPSSQT
ncbi:hypothetical protein ILYODFUR_012736 [Ilyodon furcidens]|uniref:Uncharacterized protein n=1 Tax=Ilyodon furcidens TaxID=33524 RepID=A0ABV0V585_9TELE